MHYFLIIQWPVVNYSLHQLVRPRYRLYDIIVTYDCANATLSSWVSLQQAEVQTAMNETESKTQAVNPTIFIKVVRQTCLTVEIIETVDMLMKIRL